ncbi:hypothetical protein C7460_113126 [Marinoscillum furvescens DSM 4134]|uniref:Uncharacterized protein n=2 Tax=Marinoscillum furvescens TaxID=1026 RepID=A0A3D9L1V1_MARFU|nr:hypothetical protein C7460_113126 [Marinoscillum furvescens DSM 4134]
MLLGIAVLLSGYVVYEHVTDGDAVPWELQLNRHQRKVAGESPFYNPWQYRVLSTAVVQGALDLTKATVPVLSPRVVFYGIHFLQILAICLLSVAYFRQLGVSNPMLQIVGLILISYSMASSAYKSDLSFDTYFDVIAYLCAALLILKERYVWVVPLMLLAALNRETSGLIPLMILVPLGTSHPRMFARSRLIAVGAAMLVYGVAFVAVRWYFGLQPAVGIHGMTSASEYLWFNLSFARLVPLLLGTLSVVPLIVVWRLGQVHSVLRGWFWLIVPIWVVIHFLKSTVVETRLFLVPQIIIFVPAFLTLVERWYEDRITG